jgi:hypothetical protein
MHEFLTFYPFYTLTLVSFTFRLLNSHTVLVDMTITKLFYKYRIIVMEKSKISFAACGRKGTGGEAESFQAFSTFVKGGRCVFRYFRTNQSSVVKQVTLSLMLCASFLARLTAQAHSSATH